MRSKEALYTSLYLLIEAMCLEPQVDLCIRMLPPPLYNYVSAPTLRFSCHRHPHNIPPALMEQETVNNHHHSIRRWRCFMLKDKLKTGRGHPGASEPSIILLVSALSNRLLGYQRASGMRNERPPPSHL